MPSQHRRPSPSEAELAARVTETRYGTAICLHVDGDLDEATGEQLQVSVAETRAAHPDMSMMSLDLADVGQVGTTGLDALRAIHGDISNAAEVRLVASGAALQSLRTAGLDYDVAVYPTAEAALASGPPTEDVARLREELAQRQQQLESVRVIEEAKGMLMQDFDLSADQAFDVLKTLSQETNVKLREIAEDLVQALSGKVSGNTAVTSFDTLISLRDRLRRHIRDH
jgi:anti-anti-sigma regulatory factor